MDVKSLGLVEQVVYGFDGMLGAGGMQRQISRHIPVSLEMLQCFTTTCPLP